MVHRVFSEKIVKWYRINQRHLPWRDTKNPFHIWLSEVILQQTRVRQGLPYYLTFTKEFPTVAHLARAKEEKVLRLWQGLGYYSRARNLLKCARTIVSNHEGKFPSTYDELKMLPGIGEYTAGAIASISFNQQVPVVDGNVYRVFSRYFGIHDPINLPEGRKKFSALAWKMVPPNKPGEFNQAIMEFGALHCTPKNPSCDDCVLRNGCYAFLNDEQQELPQKEKRNKIKKRYFNYLVFRKGSSLAMKKRNEKDIWQGLYDFEVMEKSSHDSLNEPLLQYNGRNLAVSFVSPPMKHVLSHQVITARFIVIDCKEGSMKKISKSLKFYTKKKISALPKPVLISRFLDANDF